jgi:hypothetical protein
VRFTGIDTAAADYVAAEVELAEREAIQEENLPPLQLQGVKGWPAPLASAAYHGLAGEILRKVDPHTEADPAGVLFSLLAAFGSAVGRGPFFRVEGDCHSANLFVVLVGSTAGGRKGTAWGRVRPLMVCADPDWMKRVLPGLSSGEGLIWAVRDPIEKDEPVKQKGRVVDYQSVIVDQGVSDKRLLAYQSEFASTLRVLGREGNTLSAVMREAWDRGDLGTLTKNSPARATGAHVGLLGHVTPEELLRYFDSTEAANGFGNRILWPCATRSKHLPEGGNLPELEAKRFGTRLREALEFARGIREVTRNDEARALWYERYGDLTLERRGLFGAVTARGAAQVVRLSLIYALLDKKPVINPEHLDAALAVWTYAKDSARFIFGDALGDATADRILHALRDASDGLTRTEIDRLFSGHRLPDVDRGLGVLETLKLAKPMKEPSGGRPVERWRAL